MLLTDGARLGPYEIISPLGAGGMGEVYRARDPRLDREVAIKVLPAHLAPDPEALARFEREAKAVAALSHPNILAIHDVGMDQGIHYAVMELLAGETLRRRLSRAPLPWRKAVEIGVAVADGVAAAQAKGITHRDLKPENIFVTADGQVKVLDFGLARVQPKLTSAEHSSAPTASAMTEPGTVMGTVAYMSPEQVRGEEADPTSDIFSFGCVLYEMVTGRYAFARQTAAETMAAILRDEPPDMAEAVKGIPPELDRITRHCLEKSAEQRFQSTRDLAFDLRAIASGSGSAKLAQSLSRFRPAPAWTLAGLLMILLGAALSLVLWRGRAITTLAILPLANGSANPQAEYLSDGITESLINTLSQLPELKVIARTTAFTYKGRAVDPVKIGRELGVRAVLTGRVVERGSALIIQADLVDVSDGSQLWGGQYNQNVADLLQVQEAIASQISEKLRLTLTREDRKRLTRRYTENVEAYRLYLKGRYFSDKLTKEAVDKAIEHFKQAIAIDPNYALAYAGLADGYYGLSNIFLPPREVMPNAEAAARKAVALDDTLAEAHASLGMVKVNYTWEWQAAERELQRAIALNPNFAIVHLRYGLYLTATGRFDEALARLRRAQALDPLSLEINAFLGVHFLFARQYDQAVEQLRRAIAMEPGFWLAHDFLGSTYQLQGELALAIAEFQKARQLDDNPTTLAKLGHVYAAAGRRDESIKILDELKALATQRYVSPYFVAIAYMGLGDTDQVFAWLEKTSADRNEMMIWLKSDPIFESLHSDPRFADLLRRVGLAP